MCNDIITFFMSIVAISIFKTTRCDIKNEECKNWCDPNEFFYLFPSKPILHGLLNNQDLQSCKSDYKSQRKYKSPTKSINYFQAYPYVYDEMCIASTPNTNRWIGNNVDSIDDRIGCRNANDKMEWYSGHQSLTVTGKKCQYWSDQQPHQHSVTAENMSQIIYLPIGHVMPLSAHKNYCRNVASEEVGPWCYTQDKTAFREPCFTVCKQANDETCVNLVAAWGNERIKSLNFSYDIVTNGILYSDFPIENTGLMPLYMRNDFELKYDHFTIKKGIIDEKNIKSILFPLGDLLEQSMSAYKIRNGKEFLKPLPYIDGQLLTWPYQKHQKLNSDEDEPIIHHMVNTQLFKHPKCFMHGWYFSLVGPWTYVEHPNTKMQKFVKNALNYNVNNKTNSNQNFLLFFHRLALRSQYNDHYCKFTTDSSMCQTSQTWTKIFEFYRYPNMPICEGTCLIAPCTHYCDWQLDIKCWPIPKDKNSGDINIIYSRNKEISYNYQGKKNQTANQVDCLHWSDVLMQKHLYETNTFELSLDNENDSAKWLKILLHMIGLHRLFTNRCLNLQLLLQLHFQQLQDEYSTMRAPDITLHCDQLEIVDDDISENLKRQKDCLYMLYYKIFGLFNFEGYNFASEHLHGAPVCYTSIDVTSTPQPCFKPCKTESETDQFNQLTSSLTKLKTEMKASEKDYALSAEDTIKLYPHFSLEETVHTNKQETTTPNATTTTTTTTSSPTTRTEFDWSLVIDRLPMHKNQIPDIYKSDYKHVKYALAVPLTMLILLIVVIVVFIIRYIVRKLLNS